MIAKGSVLGGSMGELRDYQRVFVDNLIEDINTIATLTDAQFQAIQDKLESRIGTYDRERWEQIERDLPDATLRAVESIKC